MMAVKQSPATVVVQQVIDEDRKQQWIQ